MDGSCFEISILPRSETNPGYRINFPHHNYRTPSPQINKISIIKFRELLSFSRSELSAQRSLK